MSTETRMAAGFLLALGLLICSCNREPNLPVAPPQPNGGRLPLKAGHWAGTMQSNLVNFYIDSIASDHVAIHLNGGSISPTAKNTPGNPVSFSDRPTTCKRNADGVSFDCLRYKDMHIDNGFLCGVYQLYGQVFYPCFASVQ